MFRVFRILRILRFLRQFRFFVRQADGLAQDRPRVRCGDHAVPVYVRRHEPRRAGFGFVQPHGNAQGAPRVGGVHFTRKVRVAAREYGGKVALGNLVYARIPARNGVVVHVEPKVAVYEISRAILVERPVVRQGVRHVAVIKPREIPHERRFDEPRRRQHLAGPARAVGANLEGVPLHRLVHRFEIGDDPLFELGICGVEVHREIDRRAVGHADAVGGVQRVKGVRNAEIRVEIRGPVAAVLKDRVIRESGVEDDLHLFGRQRLRDAAAVGPGQIPSHERITLVREQLRHFGRQHRCLVASPCGAVGVAVGHQQGVQRALVAHAGGVQRVLFLKGFHGSSRVVVINAVDRFQLEPVADERRLDDVRHRGDLVFGIGCFVFGILFRGVLVRGVIGDRWAVLRRILAETEGDAVRRNAHDRLQGVHEGVHEIRVVKPVAGDEPHVRSKIGVQKALRLAKDRPPRLGIGRKALRGEDRLHQVLRYRFAVGRQPRVDSYLHNGGRQGVVPMIVNENVALNDRDFFAGVVALADERRREDGVARVAFGIRDRQGRLVIEPRCLRAEIVGGIFDP